MIEATVDIVEGVRFIKSIRILKSDTKRHGVSVHLISYELEREEPDFIKKIKLMGLRKVGYDDSLKASEYAEYPMNFLRYHISKGLLGCYWAIVSWLYDNARVFKQIPISEPFSWSYFTPYVWYKDLRNRR